MLKEAVHGGDVERVARRYGFKPSEILDYSANINPLPLPSYLKELVAEHFDQLGRYPDRDYFGLRQALSQYSGCPAERILVGNGATELLYLAVRAFAPRRALLAVPSFADYQRSLEQNRCRVKLFPQREEEGFRLDVARFCRELDREFDMVILCSPNNPTGNLLSKAELLAILEKARQKKTMVVLDQCFAEFIEDQGEADLVEQINEYPQLLLLRALTKFFGVPGLRLGYCLAAPASISRMKAYQEPWTVNALANLLAPPLLADRDFIARTREWITTERPWMYRELKKITGLKVYESQANFFLIRVVQPGWTVPALKELLEKKGIMIRDASSFAGLDGSFARLAVRDRKGNVQVLQELAALISHEYGYGT